MFWTSTKAEILNSEEILQSVLTKRNVPLLHTIHFLDCQFPNKKKRCEKMRLDIERAHSSECFSGQKTLFHHLHPHQQVITVPTTVKFTALLYKMTRKCSPQNSNILYLLWRPSTYDRAGLKLKCVGSYN